MIYQLQHQPQQTHIHARNNKMSNNYIGILEHNRSSQCKTRNVENVNDKCFNYYSNGGCSLSQPRNSNRSYTKHICVSGGNCNNGVDIVHNNFTNNNNNNNNNNSNSSNPEYVQILKNKINELQHENEMLKDKYSYVSEMLSSERNNIMLSCYNSNSNSNPNCNNNNNVNINTYERDYQSLNELKQENLQFKQQIEILSQRIATLEAEKKQYEQDTYTNHNNNYNYNTIDATNNINNSTTLNTINTSRKPKYNTCNNHSTTTTTSKYNRNSISYGNTTTTATGTARKGIMNLKKKSSNINKIKHSACNSSTTTTKHSPRSAVIKKAKMKIKIPKSATNNNECMKECDVVVKDINSVYNVNTQIQKTEMNVLKLSNEFNKLINQRYCDNEIVKDVITKVSNDLISKTEELLTLYKQQHSMITMHLE